MSVYHGVVKRGNTIVLPENVHLAEGTVVEVRPSSKEAQSKPPSSEDQFKQRLVELGLLKEIGARYQATEGADRAPLQVEGKPLSQIIIEERR